MKLYALFGLIGILMIGLVLVLKPEPALPDPTPEKAAEPMPPSVSAETGSTGSQAIGEEEARELMDDLWQGTPEQAETAVARILAADDQRFISVFIELLRGGQLGLVRNLAYENYGRSLDTLTGQQFGSDWPAWVEWYGRTDLEPPPGFTSWKGRMLALIDPGFGEFLQDSHPSNIRAEEIQWGGVRVDGIPALDEPAMVSAGEADYLAPEDVVFGLAVNGDARAYPLRILDWHEMANDVIGGVPVSLAYCTLCGAAIAFDGRASNGATYTFGSSGFLFRSNKLMYDRQTRTLWNQLTGMPVLGELVNREITLNILPVVLTSWADWRSRHPDTLVLDIDTGFPRNYTPGAAYGNYFASEETMFPVAQRSDLLAPKAQVYVIRQDGLPKAYPVEALAKARVINDTLGDTPVVLVAPGKPLLVDGDNQYVGEVTYQAGSEVRAYDRGDETFTLNTDGRTLTDSTGNTWQVTESALIGPDGRAAPRLAGHLAYWFGWFSFFPNTLVYGK